jgi:hypothetical protein
MGCGILAGNPFAPFFSLSPSGNLLLTMEIQGGDKLEKALASIAGKMHGSVKVGFLEGATYPDGTPVAAVAFWNEYGHGGRFPAPPRPFFRNTIAAKASEWGDRLAKAAKYYNYDGAKVFGLMGQTMVEDIQEGIQGFDGPELSKTTLMLRSMYGNNPQEIRARDVLAAQELVAEGHAGAGGSQAKPLIWTGHMQSSVDYEVEA